MFLIQTKKYILGRKRGYIAKLRKTYAETGEINLKETLCPSGGELRLDNTKNENYSSGVLLLLIKVLIRNRNMWFLLP